MRFCMEMTVPEKHMHNLPSHIEGREKGTDQSQYKRQLRCVPSERGVKYFVFAPESGEQQWEARERHHTHCISREGNRHRSPQSSHPGNVLLFMRSVDDRARAE